MESGLQEPSGEPVPNNGVHLKSPGGEGGEKEKQIKERESWEEKEEERENSGSPGYWSLGKRREGRKLKFQLFDVSLQLLGVPAPQPCSPGALAASCADWRSELRKESNMTRRV